MAYGIKYRCRFDSLHGVETTVNILKNGYSGSVINRPLGKAPVIRMNDGDPFRATSCDLSIECQVDGEFAEFYTSDPFEFRVDVYRGSTQIWTGFIATELYSEPNIAPPYDVAITATDGLGTLKEYDFEAAGVKTLGAHMRTLLGKNGLELSSIDWVMKLSAAGGTVPDFVDTVAINLDYLVGEDCYTVLETLLRSLHATITQYAGRWLIIRETDMTVASSGNISIYRTPARTGSTTATTITGGRKSVGKMGVADMWPVGYTTRRVVPAKKRSTVEAPWNIVNAAYSVQDNAWTTQGSALFVEVGNGNSYYSLSGNASSISNIMMARVLPSFTKSLEVKVRCAIPPSLQNYAGIKVGVIAKYTPDGGTDYYWDGESWSTAAPTGTDSWPTVDVATDLASEASEQTFNIPAPGTTTTGEFYLYVAGILGVRIFDVDLRPIVNKGYRDEIVISNGARGDGDTVSITGGRMTQSEYSFPASYQGIWLPGINYSTPVYLFTDNNFASKDFLSIQALGRAMSVALPRVETSGTLDVPANMALPPVVIRANNVNSLVKSYDWNLNDDEMRFTAITLPSADMTVTSETVKPIGNA